MGRTFPALFHIIDQTVYTEKAVFAVFQRLWETHAVLLPYFDQLLSLATLRP